MIQSTFKSSALLPLIPALVVSWILYELRGEIFPPDKLSFVVYLCLALFLFILIWIFFGELRTKALKVIIDGDQIRTRNFFGLGFSKRYYFHEMDGFKTADLPATKETYEFLYLVVNNKKVIKISEFYHRNYPQMKQYIITKVPDLGYEDFSLLREVKEIFK